MLAGGVLPPPSMPENPDRPFWVDDAEFQREIEAFTEIEIEEVGSFGEVHQHGILV